MRTQVTHTPPRTMARFALAIVVLAVVGTVVEGFMPRAPVVRRERVAVSGIWDAVKKGFENEKFEGPVQNAGLKNVS